MGQRLQTVSVWILRLAIGLWSLVFLYYLQLQRDNLIASNFTLYITVAILIVVFVSVLVSGMIKVRHRSNATLAIFSVFIALYLAEAMHLSLFYYPGFPEYSPPISIDPDVRLKAYQQNVNLDKRNQFEVVRDLRLRGIDGYPAFLVNNRKEWGELWLTDKRIWPLGGHSNKTTVHCNESGYWAKYQSDERGFNNPLGSWEMDEASQIDLLLLGDSFVHGACVNGGDDYGGLLRSEEKRVVNLGQRGNGPILNFAGLVEYGLELKPRKILWFYTENNDLINLRAEASNVFLRNYLTPGFSQDLRNRVAEVDHTVNIMTNKHWNRIDELQEVEPIDMIRYWVSLRSLRKRFGLEAAPQSEGDTQYKVDKAIALLNEGRSTADFNDVDASSSKKQAQNVDTYLAEQELFVLILQKAINLATRWNGEVVFVYVPGGDRFMDRLQSPLNQKDTVIDRVRDLGVDVIDLTEAFNKLSDPMTMFPFGRGGHYNSLGYAYTSKHILRNLE
ncbi:MAG: hypothetical protein CL398_01695 [Acidiferrobacteraceae bacterium]|nr:hypothetical protein [Acidiferrobacteraceae bacterium]